MNAVDTERARFNMIEQQIRPWDVLDLDVLDLLQQVKREDFVPLAHRALAFVDMEIPLTGGADDALRNGRCMLAPRVEARMLQDVAPKGHEKILEVGTGSGYMAALLASRAQRVITLEIHPELARLARENLQKAGLRNVEVREADGAKGLAAEGPFDAIVLSGSVYEVPQGGWPAGGHRRQRADDARDLHHPQRRGLLDDRAAVGHGGPAAGELPGALALPLLMPA
jgi:protein-L-isoaspartate(D-aspartate) O-methyltransferase